MFIAIFCLLPLVLTLWLKPKQDTSRYWPTLYRNHCLYELGMTEDQYSIVNRLLSVVPLKEVGCPNYINTDFDSLVTVIAWNFGHNVTLEITLNPAKSKVIHYRYEGAGETKEQEIPFLDSFPSALLRAYHYAENVADDLR